jgi:hypothetical protein
MAKLFGLVGIGPDDHPVAHARCGPVALRAVSSVSPVLSRPSDASTELSVSPRIASQLTAYPIGTSGWKVLSTIAFTRIDRGSAQGLSPRSDSRRVLTAKMLPPARLELIS